MPKGTPRGGRAGKARALRGIEKNNMTRDAARRLVLAKRAARGVLGSGGTAAAAAAAAQQFGTPCDGSSGSSDDESADEDHIVDGVAELAVDEQASESGALAAGGSGSSGMDGIRGCGDVSAREGGGTAVCLAADEGGHRDGGGVHSSTCPPLDEHQAAPLPDVT